MNKVIVIISLALALVLFGYYEMTGNETVLAPLLLSLLVSFTFAMLLLTKK